MDRLTRKELKRDRFALEVEHTVGYLSEHRPQVRRYGTAAAVILLLAAGTYFYRKHQHYVRQEALNAVLRIQDAQVGQAPNEFVLSFPNEGEKQKAVIKAFTELASKYSGSEEAIIARYYLGGMGADQGRVADAEKFFREVIDSGNVNYGSLARLSLAELYAGQGKVAEVEKLLRPLIEKPTVFVSKEQATIVLAKLLSTSKPAEARKLLEPLRTARSVISRTALTALSELPSQ